MDIKIYCIDCGEGFLTYEGNFSTSSVSKSGYRGQCIDCCTKARRKWVRENKEKEKERLDNFNKTVRNERRRDGRYKESEEAYKDKANFLRRENYKHKRILRITGVMFGKLYHKGVDNDWMNSKERIAIMQYKKVNIEDY